MNLFFNKKHLVTKKSALERVLKRVSQLRVSIFINEEMKKFAGFSHEQQPIMPLRQVVGKIF